MFNQNLDMLELQRMLDNLKQEVLTMLGRGSGSPTRDFESDHNPLHILKNSHKGKRSSHDAGAMNHVVRGELARKNTILQWREKRVEEQGTLFVKEEEVMDLSSLPIYDKINVD